MGCHTWFYQKSNRTKEEAKELALKTIEKNISMFRFNNEDYVNEYILREFTPEQIDWQVRFWERVKRMVDKDIISPYSIGVAGELSYYDKQKGFFIEGVTHDIFRVYGYPTIQFFDYESLKKWLLEKGTEYNLRITEEGWKKLEEYWIQYPDSMVKFG